jgi:8-oxo-dGTP pyrophosphatase MutT (NUDIX family)
MVDFIDRLKDRLAGDLPGEEAQYRMAPMLRSHRAVGSPEVVPQRQSAVLLYLYPQQEDWSLVLMKRTDYKGAHSGQVSIPGGQLEPGESHRQAALREFREETGIRVDSEQMLGKLSKLFIPASNFLVEPFVAYANEAPRFDPDPIEVEQLIELAVPTLTSEMAVKQGRACLSSGVWVQTPYFDVDGHMVWGATAMILSELKEMLCQLD